MGQEQGDGAVIDHFRGEYRFLSNFALSQVIAFDGTPCRTVEHAYKAAKVSRGTEAVMAAKSPGEAGTIARTYPTRHDWNDIRVPVMEGLVRQKFTLHPDLRAKLLATGDQELVEGNTWNDTFWGVCNGVGENQLGKILMKVRQELRP